MCFPYVSSIKKNNLLLFCHNIQLAPANGHIIFPPSSIGPRKRANYFSPTINCLQQVGILSFPNKIGSIKWAYYFSRIIKWPQQRGTLFFTNYQLAPASRHIIFQKHLIGSRKQACFPNHQLASARRHVIFPQLPIVYSMRAYYFSPTINWLQQLGVLFFPNHQMAPAKGHYFSPTINWLQQEGILFFRNIKLAPESRHMFPQSPIGFSKQACYFSPTTSWPQHAGILLSPTINWLQQAVVLFFPNHVISVTIIPLHLWPHSWGTISTVVAAT